MRTALPHRIVRAANILVGLVGLGIVALLAIPAFADLPCQPAVVPPVALTAGAFLDQLLGSLLQNGIAVLFVTALGVVTLPWMMAGLAMALVQLPRQRPRKGSVTPHS